MSATTIFHRQNQDDALLYARAFRRRCAVARRWRLARLGVSVVLGTVGVVLALLEPSTGEYISAVAAAWLLFGRAVLNMHEQHLRRDGAQAQELFDIKVLDLPWSPGIVGARPIGEDVRTGPAGRTTRTCGTGTPTPARPNTRSMPSSASARPSHGPARITRTTRRSCGGPPAASSSSPSCLGWCLTCRSGATCCASACPCCQPCSTFSTSPRPTRRWRRPRSARRDRRRSCSSVPAPPGRRQPWTTAGSYRTASTPRGCCPGCRTGCTGSRARPARRHGGHGPRPSAEPHRRLAIAQSSSLCAVA